MGRLNAFRLRSNYTDDKRAVANNRQVTSSGSTFVLSGVARAAVVMSGASKRTRRPPAAERRGAKLFPKLTHCQDMAENVKPKGREVRKKGKQTGSREG